MNIINVSHTQKLRQGDFKDEKDTEEVFSLDLCFQVR